MASENRPLRVMFINTALDVGGAETLLVNLIRRLDRSRFAPELCCLKYPGTLGEELSREIPVFAGLLATKCDLRVLPRLVRLLLQRRIDCIVTVGAGDRMFWGRLAAFLAGVPVRLTALHSTGWPDVINRLNRMLTHITDGFIGVAPDHGRYLRDVERFPARKVFVIPNGVDVDRFQPRPPNERLRADLGLPPAAPVAGIVAALRPEKDHELFLRVAARVRRDVSNARFLIVGDGPRRVELEAAAAALGIAEAVHFLGMRSDVPELLSLMDVLVLTSRIEANPVCILEAMALARPVVATRVGSIPQSVADGTTGFLAASGDEQALASHVGRLLVDPALARRMGQAGREKAVSEHSLERMVEGYERLIEGIYARKRGVPPPAASSSPAEPEPVEVG